MFPDLGSSSREHGGLIFARPTRPVRAFVAARGERRKVRQSPRSPSLCPDGRGDRRIPRAQGGPAAHVRHRRRPVQDTRERADVRELGRGRSPASCAGVRRPARISAAGNGRRRSVHGGGLTAVARRAPPPMRRRQHRAGSAASYAEGRRGARGRGNPTALRWSTASRWRWSAFRDGPRSRRLTARPHGDTSRTAGRQCGMSQLICWQGWRPV